MGVTRISWPSAAQSFGSYSGSVAAAFLAGALCAPVEAHEEYARVLRRLDVRWSVPRAYGSSFQGTVISYGMTPATTPPVIALLEEPSADWLELRALGADWDGKGAVAVSPSAIAHAKAFVNSLGVVGSTFEPFAHPNGSVGLEAQKPGKEAYLIVTPSGRFSYLVRLGDAVHRGKDVQAALMARVLALLY